METIIKLVAFDVDGTLRDRDFLPDSTRTALNLLKQNGIELALCTGRSEYEMAALREELGIDWAITCNGSHIGYQGKTVFGTSFSSDKIDQWIEEAERSHHAMLLYGTELMYCNRPDDPYFRQAQREIGFMEPVAITPATQLPAIYQCIIFCDEQDELRYIDAEQDQYYIHRWRTWAVDINPSGMNKAIGLGQLIDHLGLTRDEVAAVGDGLNDMEMIGSVGMGIAMGNGIQALKERARYITQSLDQDGIAYAVEKWILSRD